MVSRNGITGWWGMCIFNIVKLHSKECTYLWSPQQWLRILVGPYSCQHLMWSKKIFFWHNLVLYCGFNLYFLDYDDIGYLLDVYFCLFRFFLWIDYNFCHFLFFKILFSIYSWFIRVHTHIHMHIYLLTYILCIIIFLWLCQF